MSNVYFKISVFTEQTLIVHVISSIFYYKTERIQHNDISLTKLP